MPLICYKPQTFSEEKLSVIANVNAISKKYRAQGFSLTLRQIYYVFVSNDLFPESWLYVNKGTKWVRDPNGTNNAPPNYNALGDIVTDGRMAGLIDWEAVEDRTRESYANQHFQRPSEVLEAAMATYAVDKWKDQTNYVEVWVEKEALQNVLQRACTPLDVRFFACKGYTSASAMWEASQRLLDEIVNNGKRVHIIHLGDHDPSGIDMTRDIFDRLSTFVSHDNIGNRVIVHRIALNMDQVRQYNPPPNPAKVSDSRYSSYADLYGEESWELDALEPNTLVTLISDKVKSLRVDALWEKAVADEKKGKRTLECVVKYFPDVVKFLRERRTKDDTRVICEECGATQANPRCLCNDGEEPRRIG